MIEERQDEWGMLTREFGEALLDLERTFIKTVERQAALGQSAPLDVRDDPVAAYMEAWTRLDAAHRTLLPYLAEFTTQNFTQVVDASGSGAVEKRLRAVRAGGR